MLHAFCFQIIVDYCEYIDGKDVERLKFLLSEMETEVVMRTWDLGVTASIGSAQIHDLFNKSEGDTCVFEIG